MKLSTFFYTVLTIGLIAWIVNMVPEENIRQVLPSISSQYRVTCFVQEVLDDGTLSYTREYITNQYPHHPSAKTDRIIIKLTNGEQVTYNGPYVIEEINE